MDFREKVGRGSLTFALLFFAGCGTSPSRLTIMMIPRDTAEEIWVSEHGGAVDAASPHHLQIYWNGPSLDDDVEHQIALVERAVAGRFYGIILSPNNSFALSNSIQRAVSRGIPVVITSSGIPIAPEPGLSFVVNDVARMGDIAAERTDSILNGKGTVAILGLDALSPGAVERSNAFEQSLHRIAPHIEIVTKASASYSFGQAELAAEQMLHAHPNLSAIFALGINDTLGALAAVRSMQPLHPIKIIGCDQTLDLLLLLRRGDVDSLIAEDTRTMGSRAVEEIAAERNGQTVPARTLIEPVLVDRENVDDPAIQKILSERWRPQL
jgi:ribose transport system substrate-binding protein